jgi:peptidoglycan/xylan/chitin deacetylase (PgdA/CDA1 family)
MIPIRLSLGDFAPVISRIDQDGPLAEPAMAITIDDGPDPDGTPHLIAALAAAEAKATFFVCGVRVERHPALVQALVAAGHGVYAHGWDHRRFRPSEGAAAAAAMARTEALLERHRPTPSPYLVRLPFNAGFTAAAMHRALRRFQPEIQFAWSSHALADYRIGDGSRSEAEIRAACAAMAAAFERRDDLAGGVLLMHDTPITEPHASAALTTQTMLPLVLAALGRRGIRGVALQPRRAGGLGRFLFRSALPCTLEPDQPAAAR